MKIELLQLDGKLPNLALMTIAAHHRERGDEVTFRFAGTVSSVERKSWSDQVYASLIFEKSRPIAEALKASNPSALIGGTGWDVELNLARVGITTKRLDYSIYPTFQDSIGFTQRGCRLKCKFCVVPRKEGSVVEEQTIADLWRGPGYPKHLVLLDNDFFGQPNWRARVDEIRSGGFKVNFTQGINARLLNDEAAEAIASVDYRDTKFKEKSIYTAWDSLKDEDRLFTGLESLVRHGVKPRHIVVYMLVGFWPDETVQDRLYRQSRLREFGARPYPMPFKRTSDLIGFQRWCIGSYDKRVPWHEFEKARYQPRNLERTERGIVAKVR